MLDYHNIYMVAPRYMFALLAIVGVCTFYIVFLSTALNDNLNNTFWATPYADCTWMCTATIFPLIQANVFRLYGDSIIAFRADYTPECF